MEHTLEERFVDRLLHALAAQREHDGQPPAGPDWQAWARAAVSAPAPTPI